MSKPTIKQQIYILEEQKDRHHQTYLIMIKSINKEIAALRKLCEHNDVSWHPDPSGNNDRYMSCNVCGEERKSFE